MTRQEAMSMLARATATELRDAWSGWADKPETETLRGPEAGMIMLRGRIGGAGAPFNLGETTVSRAVVKLDSGEVGFATVLGRDLEKARLAAIFDGLWQRDGDRPQVEGALLASLAGRLTEEDEAIRRQTAATRVNFFTMVRGDDE